MLQRFANKRWPEWLCLSFALLMFAMAIVGTWLNFSPVPYWDMWNGTLGFILSITDGNYREWWGQHNEHRIVLSRMLFYLDYVYFDGQSRLLVPLNIVIATTSAYVFFFFSRRLSAESENFGRVYVISIFIIFAFSLSWTQHENFTWGFQSQFLLAQTLPLLSLYLIARFSDTNDSVFFWLAIFFATLSAGTMANGILALPIVLIFLFIFWPGVVKALIALIFAITIPALYFVDYNPVGGHGSIGEAVQNDPLGLIYFTAIYIGSPFFHLTDYVEGARNRAALAGLTLFVFSIIMAYRQITKSNKSPYVVALLCFILYIGATAFGTAGGRLILGMGGATSSRYATPATMAWASFTLAMIASFPSPSHFLRKMLWGATALICSLGFVYQIRSLVPQNEKIFGREMAALALELQVRDESAIGAVFPSSDYALAISAQSKERGLSIFGAYPFEGVSEAQGEALQVNDATTCIGNLDEVRHVDGGRNYLRVRGWIFDPASRSTPKVITFTNEQGIIIGRGLTGQPRPDVKEKVDHRAYKAGFGGYINRLESTTSVFAYGDDPVCRLELKNPN